jgi:hypothetical protein
MKPWRTRQVSSVTLRPNYRGTSEEAAEIIRKENAEARRLQELYHKAGVSNKYEYAALEKKALHTKNPPPWVPQKVISKPKADVLCKRCNRNSHVTSRCHATTYRNNDGSTRRIYEPRTDKAGESRVWPVFEPAKHLNIGKK